MENDMEKIRLQKILSDSGVCSRRKAEELISAGEVYVNGRKAKLGDKANERDVIMVGGERVRYTKKRRKIYIMLNKPRGYVTTMADELDGRKTLPATVSVELDTPERSVMRITIHEGRNRQIRRMCEAVGLEVVRLRRTSIGPVKLGMLKPGAWRELTAEELRALRNAVGKE